MCFLSGIDRRKRESTHTNTLTTQEKWRASTHTQYLTAVVAHTQPLLFSTAKVYLTTPCTPPDKPTATVTHTLRVQSYTNNRLSKTFVDVVCACVKKGGGRERDTAVVQIAVFDSFIPCYLQPVKFSDNTAHRLTNYGHCRPHPSRSPELHRQLDS